MVAYSKDHSRHRT